MAKKKVRAPDPPRSRRQAGPRRRDVRETPTWIKPAALAGAGALGLGVVLLVLVLVLGGGSSKSPEEALAAAGCTFRTYPDQGAQHVGDLEAKVSYNSFPPTSGQHYVQPVIWRAYTEPVAAVQEVHNLEHGGVIIHYGDDVRAETVEQLQAFYDDSPNAMLLSPLPELGDKVSLTAWTKLATCRRFDEDAFSAFRSAFRGNGPERFRVGDLQPGT